MTSSFQQLLAQADSSLQEHVLRYACLNVTDRRSVVKLPTHLSLTDQIVHVLPHVRPSVWKQASSWLTQPPFVNKTTMCLVTKDDSTGLPLDGFFYDRPVPWICDQWAKEPLLRLKLLVHVLARELSTNNPPTVAKMNHKEMEYQFVREAVLAEFDQFYSYPENRIKLQDVVAWFDKWSLRTLEPLMARLICEYNLCYITQTQEHQTNDHVPSEWRDSGWWQPSCISINSLSLYDKMIRQYSKLLFDLFGRHTVLNVNPNVWPDWPIQSDKPWETTYCQFNYFKFIAEFNLLPYLKQCLTDAHRFFGDETITTGNRPIKVGKNYYMRRRKEEQSQEAILFLHPQLQPTPPPIPEDAEIMQPLHRQQRQWDHQCMEEMEYTHTVQPLDLSYRDMSAYAMSTPEELGISEMMTVES